MTAPLPVALNPYLKPWITPLILSNDAYYIKIVVHYPLIDCNYLGLTQFLSKPENVKELTSGSQNISKHPILFCMRCF